MDRKSIAALAERLAQEQETRDPFAICRALDIPVIFTVLPDGVKGFFHRILDTKLIYLNNRLSEEEQELVCAHELGHALLHTNLNFFFVSQGTHLSCGRLEREANLFCAQLVFGGGPREFAQVPPEILELLTKKQD